MGRPHVRLKKVCYCCGSLKTKIGKTRKGTSLAIWRLNLPTSLVLCDKCWQWLKQKRKIAKLKKDINLVECVACGLTSCSIFNKTSFAQWLANRDKFGNVLHYICRQCHYNIIYYKRLYPMGTPSSLYRSGDKNPNWKGGITTLTRSIRDTDKYSIWRTDVLLKDGFKCVKCKSIDDLHVHHVKSLYEIIQLYKITSIQEALLCDNVWDINNGQTLCAKCHEDTDNFLYRGCSNFKKRKKAT